MAPIPNTNKGARRVRSHEEGSHICKDGLSVYTDWAVKVVGIEAFVCSYALYTRKAPLVQEWWVPWTIKDIDAIKILGERCKGHSKQLFGMATS